jgi:hypothetical protein
MEALSNQDRVASVTPLEVASRSRIVIIEDGQAVPTLNEPEPELDRIVVLPRKLSWFDHLLGVFCIHRSAKLRSGTSEDVRLLS